MSQADYLNKLHNELLTILEEVVRICNNHNIKYYLLGGTLLGAVRHGGFIPWDDDLDIAMPRSEMNRFMQVAPSEMLENFQIQWITTNKAYHKLHAKICRKNTEFVEHIAGRGDVDYGIFIDIFPLDEVPEFNNVLVIRKGLVTLLNKMMLTKVLSRTEGKLRYFLWCLIPNTFMHKLAERVMTLTNNRKCANYTSFASHYIIRRQTMSKSVYGEGVLIKFEGKEYNAPSNTDYVLRHVFGDNYMQLPPVERRETHMPKKVIFSDGSIFE